MDTIQYTLKILKNMHYFTKTVAIIEEIQETKCNKILFYHNKM